MHSEILIAAITIISYKPLSDLNFARYTGHYSSCMLSSPLGSISPCPDEGFMEAFDDKEIGGQ